MSDIDPNAGEKLLGASLKILDKKASEIPKIRNLIAAIKDMGEDTTEMEKQMDSVEALVKGVLKTAKQFPAVK